MAWITKNSAGATVEQRDTPYVSDEVKKLMTETYLPRYETKQAALLPTLRAVQDEVGWLPRQALMEVADFLDLTPADVIDTASFYEEFALEPVGENIIWVCRSVACEFCEHQKIVDACKDKLGIEVGETTDDGTFTLMEIECIGSCGTAPAALVGHTLHENLTPEKMVSAIDDVKQGGGQGH